MGTAYTPGLKVSGNAKIVKMRRLPIKGQTLKDIGSEVVPDDIVARTELPGEVEVVKVAGKMGVEPIELAESKCYRVAKGDKVEEDTLLAEMKFFFGLFHSSCKSPLSGTVEYISETTGNLGIRKPPTLVQVDAYVRGRVSNVLESEGVEITTHGMFIQGIFGIGGERRGNLKVVVNSPDEELTVDKIPAEAKGLILVGGSLVHADALKVASERGVKGIIVGGVIDVDLTEYLGYEIGVAITGHEDIVTTLIVTEGFGKMNMAQKTFDLLKKHEGKLASINGATQIRAGAQRPEIIVPSDSIGSAGEKEEELSHLLDIGTKIRIIRVPYFGELAEVVELPHELQTLDSGTVVRVLKAKLKSGEVVVVPRANVEII